MALDLERDAPVTEHCGTCTRCLEVCPTQAIVAPYQLDARRCISYLTIEHHGRDPRGAAPAHGQPHLRLRRLPARLPLEQVRAHVAATPDFAVRNGLDAASLVELFAWTEEEFDQRLEGSAIRRIGHERWLRNIAVALGQRASSEAVRARRWRGARRAPFGAGAQPRRLGARAPISLRRSAAARRELSSEGLCTYIMCPAS